MAHLSKLTDATAVLKAVREYDQIGRDAFLAKYKFGPARLYYLKIGDRRYDSKAIFGVAYGIENGRPLLASQFSGGVRSVAAGLQPLGFEVVRSLPDGREVPISAQSLRQQVEESDGPEPTLTFDDTRSGCRIVDLLEACHIYPGPETNMVQNGLLLRADLHTLFDLG